VIRHVASSGATPLLVATDQRILGPVRLKDIVKGGMRERFVTCARWVFAPS